MRRLLVLLAAIAGCAFPTGGAAGSPYDYVTGGGWVIPVRANVLDAHFAFTAHDGPSGATGQMQLRYVYAASEETPNEEYTADVVCLNVVGNTATLSGVITRVVNPTSGLQEGDYLTFAITDNGQPGSLLPDEFVATSRTRCPPPTPGDAVTQGNINVNEGDPLWAPLWLF